ncbi:hypothetical protein C900_04083 [Fulvivirga imtechensis AK7]|uniref:Uncharacterized protein n=1 Tax=Fulvivirga imtechensis AK7 TaxID=1237149 RepID=L8JMD9_9BACT|nr:hypothetical protein C900_04083 [Fulvivirga imtechensis AK7]
MHIKAISLYRQKELGFEEEVYIFYSAVFFRHKFYTDIQFI